MSRTSASEPVIQNAACYVMFAYDCALSILLDDAERRIHETTQRQKISHKRRAPRYFEYQPPPLRIAQDIEPMTFGSYRCRETVDLVAYDFGAVDVIYHIPIQGPFTCLLELSEQLYDNDLLLADSRRRVEQLLRVLGESTVKGGIADVVEDYVVFHIRAFDRSFDITLFCSQYQQSIAQILRAERLTLSGQEVADALATRMSFGTEDVAIVDWNAALLIDREGDDIQTVLEFANVELLEMRYLDQELDHALDQAYEALAKRSWNLSGILGSYRADLRRVAELQVDNAILFEGVNNTLKLLGDQYLARLYRLVNKRFHLDEWDASIIRKLQTLESIYEKISDQAANRRLEILEWVIIILIALSVGLEIVR